MKGGTALGVWVVASAVLLGCGGGDGSDETSTASREPQRSIDPQQQQRAEALVLELTDLPPGWRASDPDERDDADLDECSAVDLSRFTKVGDADSQDFSMGDNSEISSKVSIYATNEEAKEVLDLGAGVLTDQSQAECFGDSFEEELQNDPDTDQFEVGDAEVGELSFTPPTGVEESRAFQVVLPVEAEGASVDVVLEAVVLRQGNALVTLLTVGADDPLNPSVRDALAQVLAGKMVEAEGPSGGSTTTPET
jgi:hypothetical protein